MPRRPLILGLPARAGSFRRLSAGCAAVAFDAPAHGASTGRLASGVSFAEAVARVGARAAIGHSLGAAGLGWALAGGLRLDAAVMLAPPRGAAPFFRRFCRALALRGGMRDAVRERIRRRCGVAPEDFDLLRRAPGGSTPLLVVHDRRDREVPWEEGVAFVSRHLPRCACGRPAPHSAAAGVLFISLGGPRTASCP